MLVAAARVGHGVKTDTGQLPVASLGDELRVSCRTRWLRRRAPSEHVRTPTICRCQFMGQVRAECTHHKRRQHAPGSKTRTRSAPSVAQLIAPGKAAAYYPHPTSKRGTNRGCSPASRLPCATRQRSTPNVLSLPNLETQRSRQGRKKGRTRLSLPSNRHILFSA